MTGNLATLLFGTHRRDALALLLLHPEDALHVREIGRITGKAPGTILRELNRLADAGVIIRRPVGNQVQFQANAACPIYEDLRSPFPNSPRAAAAAVSPAMPWVWAPAWRWGRCWRRTWRRVCRRRLQVRHRLLLRWALNPMR